MKNKCQLIIIFAIFALVTACGGLTSTTTKSSNTSTAKTSDSASLGDPKSSIAYQLELIKAGDADKLRTCFTDRIKDRVTKEAVEKAKTEAAKYTIDDLVGSVEKSESDGKKTAKIKMKNGRTLTTLVETNGKWLADTMWID
jgi:hypothetical protein